MRKPLVRVFLCMCLALLAGGLIGAGVAAAQTPSDCASCHAKYPSDSFDQYSQQSPVSLSACWPCHGNMLAHGTARYDSPYGSFATAASIDLGNPATIATIHSAHRDTVRWTSVSCVNCHRGAACGVCHGSAVPHGGHTTLAGGGNDYPGVPETYSKGTKGTVAPYAYTDTLTCTNASCHGSMNATFVARPGCTNCHAVDQTGHGDVSAKHNSATDMAGCQDSGCHGSANLITEHEARSLTCDTCHKNPDPARAAVLQAAISSNNTACDACHTGAGNHVALHEAEPPAVGCTDAGCHNNNFATEHAARTNPSTGQPYDCSVCHSATARQEAKDAIAAYKADGTKATCGTCHAGASGHHAQHEFTTMDTSCQGSGCHNNFLDDEHANRGLNCGTCHANPDPVRAATLQAAIDGGDRSCSACHSAAGNHAAAHEAVPSISDPSMPYGANSCADCHSNNFMDEHARRRNLDGTFMDCATCHDSARPDVVAAIAAGGTLPGANTPCTACHVVHGNVIAIHESPTTQRGHIEDGLECNECHASNLGTVHDAAGLGCSACHDSTDPAVLGAIRSRNTQCSACHSAYHTGLPGKHAATSPESDACGVCHDKDPDPGMSVTLIHAGASEGKCAVCHDNPARVGPITSKTAECASCHTVSGTDYHRNMAVHNSPEAATCSNQCHHRSPDVTVIHGTNGCITCHTNPAVDTSGTTACSNCHFQQGVDYHPKFGASHEPTDTASGDCARCHGGSTDVRDLHAAQPGDQSSSCSTCHTGVCQDCHTPHGWGAAPLLKTTKCATCHNTVGTNYHENLPTKHTYGAMDPSCVGSGCHAANTLPEAHEPYMSRYPEYADTCAMCHLNSDPERIPAGATANCGDCHTFHTDLPAQHTAGSATSQSCVRCHQTLNAMVVHENRVEGECAVCHANPTRGNLTTGKTSADCEGCHATEKVDYHSQMDAKHLSPTTPSCFGAGCHDPSQGLPQVHALYAGPGTGGSEYADSCALCHLNVDPGRIDWNTATATCTGSCHGTPHQNMNHRATSATSQECVGCHGSDWVVTVHGADGTSGGDWGKCATCHNNPARGGDLTWDKANSDCEQCHLTPEYPYHQEQDTKHTSARADCGACHGTSLPSIHIALPCATCHNNAGRIGDITSKTADCGDCHFEPTWPYHEDKTAKHTSAASCATCHGDNLETVHETLECVTCHDNPTRVGDITSKTANCADCHFAPEYPFHGNKDAKHTSTSTCASCHGSNLETVHTALSCATCHDNPTRVGDITSKTADCADCHYAPEYPYHLQKDAKHTSSASCAHCHGSNLETVHTALSCATCHNNPTRVGDVTSKTANCADCHHAPQYPFHGQMNGKHNGSFGSGDCATCHSASLETEHSKPTAQTDGGQAITCETCHAGTASPVSQVKPWNKQCGACHAGAANGHTAQHDIALDAQCQICHASNLISTHAAKSVTCAGCHSYTSGSLSSQDVSAAIAGGNKNCDACHKSLHPDLQPGTNASFHSSFGSGTNSLTLGDWIPPWTQQSQTKCTDCHAASSSYPLTAKDGSTVYLVLPYQTTSAASGGSWGSWGGWGSGDSSARPSNLLCFKCHDSSFSNSGFENWHNSEHGDYGCFECHEVHGSKNRRLIGLGGEHSLNTWVQHTGNYSESDCGQSGCEEHDRTGNSAGTIAGKVTDAGNGNNIKLAKLTGTPYDLVGYTDAGGNYFIPNVRPGSYTLTASTTGLSPKTATVSVSGNATATVNFALGQPGAIRGKVTDSIGVALSGVTVSTDKGGYTATTAGDGTYELAGVSPDTYVATASKTGYATGNVNVTVGSGQAVTGIDFALAAGNPNLALNRTITASSYDSGYPPSNAVDGSTSTRWRKNSSSSHWLRVDLGSSQTVKKFVVKWYGSSYAKSYRIQTATTDGIWSTQYSTTSGSSGDKTVTLSTSKTARYVRLYCLTANGSNGYSVTEFEIYSQ